MNPALVELRDWQLPAPVSWWPPAPGWWLLAGLVLLALWLLGHWWWRRYRRFAGARRALRELAALQAQAASLGTHELVTALARLLRRVALQYHPRERVAGLAGADWTAFLDGTGGRGDFAATPAGRLLAARHRRPDGGMDDAALHEPLIRLVRRWIRAQPCAAQSDRGRRRGRG